MQTINILTLFFIFTLNPLLSFANFQKGKQNPLCNNERIQVYSLALNAHDYLDYAKKRVKYAGFSKGLLSLSHNHLQRSETNSELCLWNRFIFLDFMVYFGWSDKVLNSPQTESTQLELLKLRDYSYSEWAKVFEREAYSPQSLHSPQSNRKWEGLLEWHDQNLKSESIESYLGRGSQLFGWLEFIAKIVRHRPNPETNSIEPNHTARTNAFDILQAKTPFTSIFGSLAVKKLSNLELQNAVSCLHEKFVLSNSCLNLYSSAQACSLSNEMALEVLAIYSSQRIYLIRDFTHWLRSNLNKDDFNAQIRTLIKGSEIYFTSETKATECGVEMIHPAEVSTLYKKDLTQKLHHFYPTAYLGYQLAKTGTPFVHTIEAATESAKIYKRVIGPLGVIANIQYQKPLFFGTAGDVETTIRQQERGAEFGFNLWNSDAEKTQQKTRPDLLNIEFESGDSYDE